MELVNFASTFVSGDLGGIGRAARVLQIVPSAVSQQTAA